jgi:uncharacterized membrane protein (UPF0127 family)
MFAYAILLTILQQAQIQIGEEKIKVEIADSPRTREQGLMGRKELPEGFGMLFVYEEPKHLSFWMKDTEIPLSIAFFDEDKKLIEIHEMPVIDAKNKTPPHFKSSREALYALEVPQKWFSKKGIGRGAKFSFLDQTDRLE